MHYRRAFEKNPWRKKPFGDPGPAHRLRTPLRQPEKCQVGDCSNKPRTWGICDMHRGRFLANGTTDLIRVESVCSYCGSSFSYERKGTDNGTRRYCTDSCRRLASTQRARLRQVKVQAPLIDWRQVAERDGWDCKLCGLPVDTDARPRTRSYPSVDHITPLSLGGQHSWDNVQLAHFGCNARKQNRLVR